MVTIVDYVAYGDAFVVGWITIDYLTNIILNKGKTFTKIRYFRSRFATRDNAIVLSIVQILIAMVVSYYIVDWIFGQITPFLPSIIPITLATFGLFYFYVLLGLPMYKITIKRALPSIVPIVLAFLIHWSPEIAKALATLIGLS